MTALIICAIVAVIVFATCNEEAFLLPLLAGFPCSIVAGFFSFILLDEYPGKEGVIYFIIYWVAIVTSYILIRKIISRIREKR